MGFPLLGGQTNLARLLCPDEVGHSDQVPRFQQWLCIANGAECGIQPSLVRRRQPTCAPVAPRFRQIAEEREIPIAAESDAIAERFPPVYPPRADPQSSPSRSGASARCA